MRPTQGATVNDRIVLPNENEAASLGDWDHLRSLAGLIADWVWEQDPAGRFTRVFGSVIEGDPTGRPADVLGKTREDLGLRADDVAASDAPISVPSIPRPAFRDVVFSRTLADGSQRYIQISGAPYFDTKGRCLGYRGVGRDVTAHQTRFVELRRFQLAMNASPDTLFVTDVDAMRFLHVNDTACSMTGYAREEFLRTSPTTITRQTPEQLAKAYAEAIAAGSAGVTAKTHMVPNRDGSRRGWWELHRRATQVDGRWLIVTVSREVTARVLAEETAHRAKRMYATLGATNEAIMRGASRQDVFQQVCNAAVQAGGFASASILLADSGTDRVSTVAIAGLGEQQMRSVTLSIDPETAEGQGLVGTAIRTQAPCISNDFLNDAKTQPWHALAVEARLKSCAAVPIRRGGRVVGALQLCSTEKRAFDEETVALLERVAENLAFAMVNFEREAERQRTDGRVRHLAMHDSLTGLPNRLLFSELLAMAIRTAQRHQRGFAVMSIDIDRFKILNESLGCDAGDELLKEIAKRLRSCLRASDVVARFGSDKFVVLLSEADLPDGATRVGRRLLEAVIEPMNLLGQECRVTASIGISTFPKDGSDMQTLLKNADMAMYQAKEEGKNSFQFYAPGMKAQPLERLTLEAALRTALAEDQFFLHYQPKLDLKTGRIRGAEALLRWSHPEFGVLSPAQFIQLAEETGLIVPIGRWVLKTACAQSMAWQRLGLPPVAVAVNVSARQFAGDDLLRDVVAALESSGMPPELLELEITEGTVMVNPVRALTLLKKFKALGIRIAMDDFGLGHASLEQIKGLPIDILKVDRSFIKNLPDSTQDRAITEAVIQMAKTLSLVVVAEGVETQAQEAFLRDLACDASQGYFFARPCAEADFAELLRRHVPSIGPNGAS